MPGDAPNRATVEAALLQAIGQLAGASNDLQDFHRTDAVRRDRLNPDAWQETLGRIGTQLGQVRRVTAQVSEELGLGSAQDRLLRYFRAHVGEVLHGDALSGVAGISAWARRIRELRVEHGWPIESRVQRSSLARDEYVLVADTADAELAASWRLAKRIRGRNELSGKARVLEYLTAVSPRPADQDQLDYVAKIKSWQRRMRELDEEGWEIRSNIDEPQLPPGTYRLASLERRPPRAREAIKLRYSILERDRFTCQDCGAVRGEPDVRLQAHHILPVHQGGSNEPRNLVTLCAACHAGRHALDAGSTSDELLVSGGEPSVPLRA